MKKLNKWAETAFPHPTGASSLFLFFFVEPQQNAVIGTFFSPRFQMNSWKTHVHVEEEQQKQQKKKRSGHVKMGVQRERRNEKGMREKKQ